MNFCARVAGAATGGEWKTGLRGTLPPGYPQLAMPGPHDKLIYPYLAVSLIDINVLLNKARCKSI